jgi:hypothetical protein
MSFIGYDYPLVEPTVPWPQFGLRLAGLDDIACMKLSAIVSRGSRKDFIDLHYLIRHFHPLGEYLEKYKKKYRNCDIGHVVRSRVYFADAETEPPVRMLKPVSWKQVKSDFERWVADLRLE